MVSKTRKNARKSAEALRENLEQESDGGNVGDLSQNFFREC